LVRHSTGLSRLILISGDHSPSQDDERPRSQERDGTDATKHERAESGKNKLTLVCSQRPIFVATLI